VKSLKAAQMLEDSLSPGLQNSLAMTKSPRNLPFVIPPVEKQQTKLITLHEMRKERKLKKNTA